MLDIVQPHSTLPVKPETGESFFRRAPADHEPGVDDSKPRATVIWVPESTDSSWMRSSRFGVPMRYRPPVSCEESSTVHAVLVAPTPAVRKQPSWRSCSTFSNRGANTMYILRQSLIGTTAPSLSSKVCVKSSVKWYFVVLSPLVNKSVAPLPAVHWNPCPLPTGTPASVRP